MRPLLTTMVLTVGLLAGASASTPPQAAPAIAWRKPDGAKVEAIFAQARKSNKPVFLYWGAVWCPPCNQIKATVFTRPDFAERSKSFLAVYIDGDTPGAQKLGAQFKVMGYPTMIVFKPDGTELTRIPGEVDAARYMEVLDLALASSSSVKESLATALGPNAASLTPQAWRQLAFYSWEQDQAQLVPEKDRPATLRALAQACPPAYAEASTRLLLKTAVAFAQNKTALPAPEATQARLREVLSDPALTRTHFDTLENYASDLVQALSAKASPERATLVAALNNSLDNLAKDASLTRSDQLGAVQAKLDISRIDAPEGGKAAPAAALVAQARSAAQIAERETTDAHERQAIVPNAAHLLADAGLLDESDAMLKAELPKAISPYYHMLVLSSNAKKRGDKAAALDWAERAWKESKGPATRMQWGSGYISKLLEMSPQDSARIEKAATGLLSEVSPTPETFYERNRRVLQRLGKQLLAWNDKGEHQATINKLSRQLDQVCSKLPREDEARKACSAVFKPSNNKV